jgi:Zn-dependent oligopeptidase
MASPPFRIPPQPPLVFTHTPTTLLTLTQETITSSNNNIKKPILTNPTHATFKTTILPLIHNENTTLNTALLAALYRYVSPSPSLREASITCSQLFREHWREVEARREVFEVFRTVYERERKS